MLVELRSSDRLRGPKALDVSPVLASVLDAAREGTADLSRLRVVCDWIQYKRNSELQDKMLAMAEASVRESRDLLTDTNKTTSANTEIMGRAVRLLEDRRDERRLLEDRR